MKKAHMAVDGVSLSKKVLVFCRRTKRFREIRENDHLRWSAEGTMGEDRINNLPEDLVDSILERVPFEDAVRTSIISKTWRYRWTEIRALVFDKTFSNKFAKNEAFGHNEFIKIINQVLTLHKGHILKFHLHIPNMSVDSFQEVDQWMLLLSRNGVRELILTSSNQRYELPSYVFYCLELTKLELENCFFKPPLEFEGFLNLEKLLLKDIDFGANLCGTKMNLPQLKTLSLYSCTNVYNFNIKATKLRNLTVIACPDAMLATLLSNLTKIRFFYIDAQFLKMFTAENIPKWFPHPVNSLRHLWFGKFQFGDLDQLHGVLCLLRNSPNLKTLTMNLEMEPQADIGPASSILKSPNSLDYKLCRLKTVEIRYLEGSIPELLFIKLLLAHSPSLQKFTIKPSRASNVQKRLEIAMKIMQFPRASTKAKMFYFGSLYYPFMQHANLSIAKG
ncbi:unnamed protein product [Lactuca virosa]|uniref:F-box domain-containing protein n=1 Tax=Lactuca virosa TaxID=75947 RepID=A0AAU9NTA0_9ASTR|nr:unnamed protein product [Lactuca virosa]